MSAARLNQISTLDVHTLKQGLDQQTVTLVDVREPIEFAGERIPGAILVPLSQFNLRKIPQANNLALPDLVC